MEADPFDDLLGLEEQFYNEGYQLGVTDGKGAGKIEGRLFGLEKGFEKFVEAGKLHGRSVIWATRLAQIGSSEKRSLGGPEGSSVATEVIAGKFAQKSLPQVSQNARLSKHVRFLYALVEPDTLSITNSEDSVSDFDDRLKRAHGKVKLIEKLVGEESRADGQGQQQQQNSGNNIEEVDILKTRQ